MRTIETEDSEALKRIWREIKDKDPIYTEFCKEGCHGMTQGQINRAYIDYRFDNVKNTIAEESEESQRRYDDYRSFTSDE